MRRTNTQTLKQVLGELTDEMDLSRKIKEIRLIKQWPDMMGPAITKVTENIYIRKKTLYIHLSSSAARNELLMMREAIIQVFNKKAGEEIIKKIILK